MKFQSLDFKAALSLPLPFGRLLSSGTEIQVGRPWGGAAAPLKSQTCGRSTETMSPPHQPLADYRYCVSPTDPVDPLRTS